MGPEDKYGPIEMPRFPWMPVIVTSIAIILATLAVLHYLKVVRDNTTLRIAAEEREAAKVQAELPNIEVILKANDADDELVIKDDDLWYYNWITGKATACEIAFPTDISGISLGGSSGPIGPGHPWYPTKGRPTRLVLDCTDGVSWGTDSILISLAE